MVMGGGSGELAELRLWDFNINLTRDSDLEHIFVNNDLGSFLDN
jgi:hypothetical protein